MKRNLSWLRLLKSVETLAVCCLLFAVSTSVQAKKYPEIKFEKTTIDLGVFSQDEPIRKCVFKFTNVGKAPLIINYVHPSCGCTVAEYPKEPIAPGASGEINVTYDGTGKMPGPMSKYVQVFTNCQNDLTRIFIKGEMTAMHSDAVKPSQQADTTKVKN